jgi:deazaflavin-dependent oxidoreductase (nitroreductase family)
MRRWLNRAGSTFLRVVLRSPLHGLLSGSLMVIRVRGRTTGKPYELPVMYAQDGQTLWIFCQQAERKSWWRNLREKSDVTVWLRGRQQPAAAQLLDGCSDSERAMSGLAVWLRRYPRAARRLGMPAAGHAPWGHELLAELVRRDVLVRVRLSSG